MYTSRFVPTLIFIAVFLAVPLSDVEGHQPCLSASHESGSGSETNPEQQTGELQTGEQQSGEHQIGKQQAGILQTEVPQAEGLQVREPQAGVDTFHVLNYNIRHGRGLDDNVDLRRIAEVILQTDADLVALQEVDMGVERSYGFDLMKVFSGYTGLEPVFYKNIPFQGGEYGNAIMSAFPVASSRNLHYIMKREGEQRGLLQAEIDMGDFQLAFMNTHIDYRPDDTERMMNVEQIIETKRAYRGMPVLIVGDFNDVPDSRVHNRMKEYFTDVWEVHGEGDGLTFHAEDPDRRIDYIFYTNNLVQEGGPEIRPVAIEVLDSDASDHLPILTTFVIER